MATSNGPKMGLLVNGVRGDEHYLALMKLFRAIDAFMFPYVNSIVPAVPTTGMQDGDMYILTAAPNQNTVARYSSVLVGWEYFTPKDSWEIAVLDQQDGNGQYLSYEFHTGTGWVEKLAAGGLTVEQGDLRYDKLIKNNVTATTNPGVNDDSSQGYAPLSKWVNTVTHEIWLATSVAVGAANWQQATLTIDELGNAALATIGTADANLPNTLMVKGLISNAAAFGGANVSQAGTKGLVPAPSQSELTRFLSSLGTWITITVPDDQAAEGANLGENADAELFVNKVGKTLNFRSLKAFDASITITEDSGIIYIKSNLTDPGGGGGGDGLPLENLGNGVGVVAGLNGEATAWSIRTIEAGDNITLGFSPEGAIIINSTAGDGGGGDPGGGGVGASMGQLTIIANPSAQPASTLPTGQAYLSTDYPELSSLLAKPFTEYADKFLHSFDYAEAFNAQAVAADSIGNVYVVTQDTNGGEYNIGSILVSNDYGQNWVKSDQVFSNLPRTVAASDTCVLVGTYGNTGGNVYRSTNNGVSFSTVPGAAALINRITCIVRCYDGSFLACGYLNSPNDANANRLMRSTDDGLTWSLILQGTSGGDALAWTNADSYTSKVIANVAGKWRFSGDYGATWADLPEPDGFFMTKLATDGTVWRGIGNSESVNGTDYNVMYSNDDGQTWELEASIGPNGGTLQTITASANGLWAIVASAEDTSSQEGYIYHGTNGKKAPWVKGSTSIAMIRADAAATVNVNGQPTVVLAGQWQPFSGTVGISRQLSSLDDGTMFFIPLVNLPGYDSYVYYEAVEGGSGGGGGGGGNALENYNEDDPSDIKIYAGVVSGKAMIRSLRPGPGISFAQEESRIVLTAEPQTGSLGDVKLSIVDPGAPWLRADGQTALTADYSGLPAVTGFLGTVGARTWATQAGIPSMNWFKASRFPVANYLLLAGNVGSSTVPSIYKAGFTDYNAQIASLTQLTVPLPSGWELLDMIVSGYEQYVISATSASGSGTDGAVKYYDNNGWQHVHEEPIRFLTRDDYGNIIGLRTYEGNDEFCYSTDTGKTWTHIEADMADEQIVGIGCAGGKALFIATNMYLHIMWDLNADNHDHQVLEASQNSQVYARPDGGEVAFHHVFGTDTTVFYWKSGVVDDTAPQMFVTHNYGETWSHESLGSPDTTSLQVTDDGACNLMAVYSDPNEPLLAMMISTDTGRTWEFFDSDLNMNIPDKFAVTGSVAGDFIVLGATTVRVGRADKAYDAPTYFRKPDLTAMESGLVKAYIKAQ